MSDPHMVTPREALDDSALRKADMAAIDYIGAHPQTWSVAGASRAAIAAYFAAEPERIAAAERAAALKALRWAASVVSPVNVSLSVESVLERADAIENGADYA